MARHVKAKAIIRRALRTLGLEVARRKPQTSREAALGRMLALHSIDTVLDVGANEGQYGRLLREVGFTGRIISFEPGERAYQRLQEAARRDISWTVAPRCALGNQEGQIRLHVTSNDGQSSSILPILQAHITAASDVVSVGSEVVPICRLSQIASELLMGARRIFLKIDVQGYELEVLRGATELLPAIAGAQLELSLIPLYEGQALFSELMELMRGSGFDVWGIIPGLVDNSTGRLLQTDVVFFRDSPTSFEMQAMLSKRAGPRAAVVVARS